MSPIINMVLWWQFARLLDGYKIRVSAFVILLQIYGLIKVSRERDVYYSNYNRSGIDGA